MSLKWEMEKYRGEIVPPENARPTDPIDPKNRIFLDITAVAPPPSRDYFRLHVTKESVVLTQWKISHGARSVPIEMMAELGKFSKDPVMTTEVVRIFGQNNLDYIVGLSQGRYDWILTLPNPILVKIVSFVGIQNLASVAPVCQRFRQICESDPLWKTFYRQYSGLKESSISTLIQASYFSWKHIFLVNRVQDLVYPGISFQFGAAPQPKGLEAQLKGIKLVKENSPTPKLSKRRPVPAFKTSAHSEVSKRTPSTLEQIRQSENIHEYFEKIGGLSSYSSLDAVSRDQIPSSGDGPPVEQSQRTAARRPEQKKISGKRS